MALLGLRSLSFVLAGLVDRFRYLRISLGLLLVLIGTKLLLKDVLVEGPTAVLHARCRSARFRRRHHCIASFWEACTRLLVGDSRVANLSLCDRLD